MCFPSIWQKHEINHSHFCHRFLWMRKENQRFAHVVSVPMSNRVVSGTECNSHLWAGIWSFYASGDIFLICGWRSYWKRMILSKPVARWLILICELKLGFLPGFPGQCVLEDQKSPLSHLKTRLACVVVVSFLCPCCMQCSEYTSCAQEVFLVARIPTANNSKHPASPMGSSQRLKM